MFSNDLENLNEIFYNYNEKSIYKTEYENIPEKDGYLKIPYSSNIPNITLSSTTSSKNYIATNLYIFGANKTRVSQYDYQALMVIEHQPATNGVAALYTCFPLARDTLSKTHRNPIDDIIQGAQNTSLNINHLIKVDIKTAIYENKGLIYNNIVIVFDKPIYLTSSLDKFSKTPHMFSALSHIKDIPCSPMGKDEFIREGFISNEDKIREGMTDIPVFCTPIDELGDAAEFTDQIVMPAIGPLSESIQSTKLFNYAMDFVSFFFILIVIYFLVPAIYLYVFAAKIVEHTNTDDLLTKDSKDVWLPFGIVNLLYIIAAVLLVTIGSGNATYFGIIFLIIFVTSMLIILSKPDNIYKFGFGTGGISWFMDIYFIAGFVVGGLLSGLLGFLLSGMGAGTTTSIMIFSAVTMGLLCKSLSKNKEGSEGGTIAP